MARSRMAGIVLAGGVAIAVTTTDSRAQLAQASPDQEGMRDMENMRGRMGAHDGMGPIGHMHGMMIHRMMHRSPKERCEERLSRRGYRLHRREAEPDRRAETVMGQAQRHHPVG